MLIRTSLRRNTATEGASALEAWGGALEAPEISIEGGSLAGPEPAVLLGSAAGARAKVVLRAKDASLPAALQAAPGFVDQGGNRFG